jgi:hypothetical protein
MQLYQNVRSIYRPDVCCIRTQIACKYTYKDSFRGTTTDDLSATLLSSQFITSVLESNWSYNRYSQ